MSEKVCITLDQKDAKWFLEKIKNFDFEVIKDIVKSNK